MQFAAVAGPVMPEEITPGSILGGGDSLALGRVARSLW